MLSVHVGIFSMASSTKHHVAPERDPLNGYSLYDAWSQRGCWEQLSYRGTGASGQWRPWGLLEYGASGATGSVRA